LDVIVKAAVLGFSTGLYCLGFCLPVIFPLVFAEEHSSVKIRSQLIAKFLSGRLAAYLAFGTITGYVGKNVTHPLVQKLTAGSIVILSILLIFYGFLKGFPRIELCFSVGRYLPDRKLPIAMGLLTGFNICPPFLLAVTYVFQLGEVAKGIVFFLVFFTVTSVYTIPFIFIGYFSRYE
jgi:sulfite exporter TauE/SafE